MVRDDIRTSSEAVRGFQLLLGVGECKLMPTWKDIALFYPHFVQWIVQKYGSVPDGPATEEDYDRFKVEYEKETGKWGE